MLFFSSIDLLTSVRYWHLLFFFSFAVDFLTCMRYWLLIIVVFQKKLLECWHIIRVVRKFGGLCNFIIFEDL